jgi:hypothetical protein
MTERDLLGRASRELRAEHDGRFAGSGFTRGQIMKRLHAKRRRRLLGWLGFTPLAALVAGSAWAQATHSWPEVWQGMRDGVWAAWRVTASVADPTEALPPRKPIKTTPAPAVSLPAVSLPEVPAAAPAATDASDAGAHSSADAAPATNTARRARSAKGAPQPSRDPEFAEFRRAHNTHFGGSASPGAAAAYERYLSRYPDGRFVPEARYNLALLHLKAGQHSRAQTLLQGFASGAYGGYRQAEAQALLDALAQSSP